MTVPVPLADLAELLERYGAAQLLTITDDARVKVATCDPVPEDGVLRIFGPGPGTLRNLAARPQATLTWPPQEHHGFTLIVDGTGAVDADGVITLRPEHAILHRPGAHSDGPAAPYPFPGR